ncbi:MAG: MBL fold metallo-hydrolase [Methanomassiliicoccaceae archaeon]|nr:MBL fold metallo-hydrolase [Methanomassiliicoccaceae archaeon]
MRLDVLAVGNLVRSATTILEAHSTSTLIRTEETNIVVDTSSKYLLPSLKISLKQIGILPKDVGIVVLTHSHHDHCENNGLFGKAKIYIRAEEEFEGKNVIAVDRDIEIVKGVRLVHTPGHTHGSMSVFADADRKYAITGDAIPLEDNVRRMVPPGINYDAETAMKSIKSIIGYADVIVPGHGYPFIKDTRDIR